MVTNTNARTTVAQGKDPKFAKEL